jgi:hypothetical protein
MIAHLPGGRSSRREGMHGSLDCHSSHIEGSRFCKWSSRGCRVAEVFVEFTEPVVAKDGTAYIGRACGRETDNGMWQGWVEFLQVDGGEPIRSGRETTQPNRQDTAYWASGLTPVYLEGALERALNPLTKGPDKRAPEAMFDEPAPDLAPQPSHESVLNPFSVYRKGEALLRSQLSALSGWHLVNIIMAYELSEQREADLAVTPASVLVELIVSTVRDRVKEPSSAT